MTDVGVRLLGGFIVEAGAKILPEGAWRHRRAADVVKLLALARGHRIPREEIVDVLWPDLGAEAGGANLRKAIHFARKAIGSDSAIVTEGDVVRLATTTTDVEAFEEAAEVALREGDPHPALARYSGELLPEDRYAQWTEDSRRRLEAMYMRLLKAARDWERVLEVDALDEEAHRAIMRAALDAGDRRGAIRQFERLRERLRVDLGVAPDEASVALYETALEGTEPPDVGDRARAMLAWGLVYLNRRDLVTAQRKAEEARALAVGAGLGREVGEASALLGMVAHAQGGWRDVFRREFLESLETPSLAPYIFEAHLCLAEFSLYGREGHELAGEFANDLLEIARKAESSNGEALATLMLGEVALMTGDLDAAEEHLGRSAKLHELVGAVSGECIATERLAEVALARGRRWQARRMLGSALRSAETSPLAPHLVVRVRGCMVQAAGDPLEVVRASEEALRTIDVCDPCSMAFRVNAAIESARAEDLVRSRTHLEHAERIAGMWQGGPWQAAVWEARGTMRLAEGSRDQAAALFREAADLFGSMGRRLDEARCRAAAG